VRWTIGEKARGGCEDVERALVERAHGPGRTGVTEPAARPVEAFKQRLAVVTSDRAAVILRRMLMDSQQLDTDGFTILPGVLSPEQVAHVLRELSAALERQSQADGSIRGPAEIYAARNLFEAWPDVVALARTPRLMRAVTAVLGQECGLVRGLYFDKPPGASWALPWHKDMTIAVKRNDLASELFPKPTRKAGVPHVEAPESVLQTMLTVRVHLDDVDDENGPLLVVPGSYQSGKQPVVPADAAPIRPIHLAAGDALLMRPLLCHRSKHSREGTSRHRRTIHLEFAAGALPDGYEWHDFIPLDR
jgi:hypothetical protein